MSSCMRRRGFPRLGIPDVSIQYTHDQLEWGSKRWVTLPGVGRVLEPYSYDDHTLQPWKLDKVVIHWGGNTDPDGSDNVPSTEYEMAILRGWQRYHMDRRGWTDIAYCAAVGNTGDTYRLQGENRNGATSGDIDDDGIKEGSEAYAIVWIGGTRGTPTEAAYRAMAGLIYDIFDEHGEVPVTVHSDHKATACPGDDWRAWVARRGWEDWKEESEYMVDQKTWVNSLRERDIHRIGSLGIIEPNEVVYFVDLLRKTKAGEVEPEYQDWVNLRNAVAVRGPLYS